MIVRSKNLIWLFLKRQQKEKLNNDVEKAKKRKTAIFYYQIYLLILRTHGVIVKLLQNDCGYCGEEQSNCDMVLRRLFGL